MKIGTSFDTTFYFCLNLFYLCNSILFLGILRVNTNFVKKSNKDKKVELISTVNSTFIDTSTYSPSSTPVSTNVTDTIVIENEVRLSKNKISIIICFLFLLEVVSIL